jgi:hypothetical protein
MSVSVPPGQDFVIHRAGDLGRVKVFVDGRIELIESAVSKTVWCMECPTALQPHKVIIKKHYLEEHKIVLGGERLKNALKNYTCPDGVVPTGKILPEPTNGRRQINEGDNKGRIRGEVQGGAVELGK